MEIITREFVEELESERDYLISELGNTFDKDELLKLSGRLYEISRIIYKLKELEGAENE